MKTLTFEIWNDTKTKKLDEIEAGHRTFAVAEHLRNVGYSTVTPQAERDEIEIASVDDPAEGTYHVKSIEDDNLHGGQIEVKVTETV